MKIEEEIKGRFRNDYHKGIINLTYTANLLNHEFLQSLKEHGVTVQQYNVLRVLRGFRPKGPFSIGFLKARMLDRFSDVSRIVDKLFIRGLVMRQENPNDRRQKAIEITEKGLKLLAEMDSIEKKMDTLLNRLDKDEIIELNRILDKIRG
ncbi:MAG: MarR family transcriptional regulator [Bacteroidales bacterium]|nr:MarR family transcriptional regulator [Bacteroidales bacterium]